MKVETETRKQKILPLRTHFGRALMRPRWGSFAGLRLSAVLFSERRTKAVSKGGSLWFPFFRPFFVKRQRKGTFAFTERAQLGEAQGEVAESPTKSFTAFSFDAHTALRARSLCCLCLFFALPQRIGEEKALRGLPLRTPRACAVAGEITLAARRKSRQLQLLRVRLKKSRTHGSCSDFAFANSVSFCLFPCDRRKLK